MPEEVEAFIPVLRETYHLIEEYQRQHTEENEVRLRLQLRQACEEMEKFKPLMHRNWQIYLEALEQQPRLPTGDLIFALDSAVHQMHLRAGNKGLVRETTLIDGATPWSTEMKNFLDERRRAPPPQHLGNPETREKVDMNESKKR